MLQVTFLLVLSGTDKAILEALNKPIVYYCKSYIVDVRHAGHRLVFVVGRIMLTSASFRRLSLETSQTQSQATRKTLVTILHP